MDAAELGVLAPGDVEAEVPVSGSAFPFFVTLQPIRAVKSRRTVLGGPSVPVVGEAPAALPFGLCGVAAVVTVAAVVATSAFPDFIESISSRCFFKSALISPFCERMR